jgi:hypothetical protein
MSAADTYRARLVLSASRSVLGPGGVPLGLLGLLQLVAQVSRLLGATAMALGLGAGLGLGQGCELGALLGLLAPPELLGRHVVGHGVNDTRALAGGVR